ncbi:hypothetical protein GCM10023189_12460 [Nibrella saemangeumensis]|uniref:Uncharacterized protein n=1 Tax=Nibrella saemangeumensis TaxID=1084526 RepID=A0ABP8MI08_9BACT
MKNIEINLDALIRYRITPSQYVFLFLTHGRQYAALYKYGQEGNGFSAEEIQDLIDRGFIIDLNKDGYYYVDFFVVTDEVGKDLFETDREKAGLEFWNAYPVQLRDPDTGQIYSLVKTNKQRFLADYFLRIGHSDEKHQQVMEALYYAVDKGMIDMTIRQWFDSEQWTLILELKGMQQAA